MRLTGKNFACPVCGEDVPRNAKACPECGACDKSGWSGQPDDGALGLPDEDFDYEKFAAAEFGDGPRKSPMQWVWWLAGLAVLVAMIWGSLPR